MNILLLPGNSPENKEWIDEFALYCKDKFDVVGTVHYEHWKTGKQFADIEKETRKIRDLLKDWKDYIVISKSIGCAVTLSSLKQLDNLPKLVVFIGFPLKLLKERYSEVLGIMKNVEVKFVFVQKSKDIVCGYVELKVFVESLNLENYKVIEYNNPGEPIDNHHYASYEKIVEIAKMESV